MGYPKFIITSRGYLRMGVVRRHCELIIGTEQCYGGGYFTIDYVSNRLLLSGASSDFGAPRWDRITCIKIPDTYELFNIEYSQYGEDGIDISTIMEIEYY